MEIYLTIVMALIGAAVGSFLNVCIDRLPAGKSLTYPPSHCDVCQHHLSPKDLIPVFSYLRLRGRCRYCGTGIPHRVLWVELATAMFFAISFWYYGPGIKFVLTAFYFALFLVIALIDLKHQLILNKVIYPALVVTLIINLVLSLSQETLTAGIYFNLDIPPGLVNSIIGGVVGFGILLVIVIISRGMGFADVKLVALIGLVVGFPLVLSALLIGIFIGGLVSVILLLLRIKKRKDPIPFGPFLSIGTIVTIIWGNQLVSWYLHFFA